MRIYKYLSILKIMKDANITYIDILYASINSMQDIVDVILTYT